MIEFGKVREILRDCEDIIASLDGVDHNDAQVEGALSGAQKRSKAREEQAARSKSMLLLKDRLELAASLVGVEYWYARGEIDPLDPEREDDHDDGTASRPTEG